MMFNKLTTRAKLILLATFSTLLITTLGLFSISTLSTVTSRNLENIQNLQAETSALVAVENSHVHFKIQVQEWKNILIRGNNPEKFNKYSSQFSDEEAIVQRDLKKAMEIIESIGGSVSEIKALIEEHKTLGKKYRQALQSFNPQNPETGKQIDKLVKGVDRPASRGLQALAEKVEKQFAEGVSIKLEQGTVHYEQARTLLIIITIIGAILVAAISLLIAHGLLKALGGDPAIAVEAAQRISSGDLKTDIPVEVGDNNSLLAALKHMQKSLRTLISEIHTVSKDLSKNAANLNDVSENVSDASNKQNEAATAMAAATTEMSTSMLQVSTHTDQAQELAASAGKQSSKGMNAVSSAINEINKVESSFNHSNLLINDLSEQSKAISAIVNVIKDIAEQTNLLALNAAIEAARAGEQGRGFAVVADEVRGLAERTTNSTQEITSMIESIQTSTEAASKGISSGASQVHEGVSTANTAGEAITEIGESSKSLLDAVTEISSAIHDQNIASQTIAESVNLVAQMSEQNKQGVSDIYVSSKKLLDVSDGLEELVNHFKV